MTGLLRGQGGFIAMLVVATPKEALINCEKRINQCHPINPLSFDKLPYNHNLRQLEKVAGTAVKCSA